MRRFELWKQYDYVQTYQRDTGKSLSEALILGSTNPQYDNRLFNDLQVQYEKITQGEHVKNMLFTQIVLVQKNPQTLDIIG